MRVLHQVNGLGIGGVETFVYRLCKYSNEEWVGVYSHEDGVVREWLEQIGVEVYFREIESVIEERNVDIVVMHTGSFLPEYAKRLKQKFPKLKFITVLHTVWTGDDWVDKIVCISDRIYRMNDPNKATLIYPGIDRKEKFVVGEVTRLAPYKYIEDIIKVADKVVPRNPEIIFKIIGTEAKDAVGYMNHLKKLIAEKNLENNFEFLGYVKDIKYEEFDMFLHLVGDEAYPVTLLEALEHNIKTVTYDRKGTQEIKIQYPLLTLLNDWEDVAAILNIGAAGRPKHIKETAKQFNDVYREVILN